METVTKTTTTELSSDSGRRAAVNGLAVVGFVALVFVGIALAIYAARYVPETVARLGTANVFFAEIFGGSENDDLDVVPGDEVPFPENEENGVVDLPSLNEDEETNDTPAAPAAPTPTTPTVIRVPVTVPITPYGQADLSVRVLSTGYLRSNDIDTFVSDNEVPDGKRPAVKFRVTNLGTNYSGAWEWKAKLPTTSSYTYESRRQASLAPKQYVDFTLAFDKPKSGTRVIVITIDSEDDVNESNERNNQISIEIEVED